MGQRQRDESQRRDERAARDYRAEGPTGLSATWPWAIQRRCPIAQAD
jgi:hypothetical protein